MRKDLSVGVVGVGSWGRNHVRVLRSLGVTVAAVCDVNEERARNVAKEYGVERYYTSIDATLSRESLDAVTICTPSITHVDCAVKALEIGLHTFVEKPLASSIEGCLRIVDAMRSSGKMVMTGFIERFNPAVRKAMELLEIEEIGEILMIHGRRIGWWPERIGDVGVVKDTAIHDIDLTRFILKEDPTQVYARGGRHFHKLEDHVQAILSFENGSKAAFIEANWLTPRKKREMELTGSGGVISIKFLTQEVSLEKADIVIEPIVRQEEPLKLELQHFVECVSSGRRPLADAFDGLKAVAIAETILESIETGRIIELDLKSIV